jgi:hypothetical protein
MTKVEQQAKLLGSEQAEPQGLSNVLKLSLFSHHHLAHWTSKQFNVRQETPM